jgi:hypothetical protein
MRNLASAAELIRADSLCIARLLPPLYSGSLGIFHYPARLV